ncbi:MAG: septum site-determining protein MinC [Betaproteobacteria bacterium]
MNDATRVSSNAPASLDIKSANLPMVALMLKSTDLSAIEQELRRRFGEVPDFFDQDPLLIDLTAAVAAARRNDEPEPTLDVPALVQLLLGYKVRPIALRGGTETHMQAAQAAGLLLAPDARVVASSAPTPPAPTTRAAPAPAEPSEPPPLGAMVVDKPLRSGQQVYARGRDLVVMAMVNAGAEVIADGSIHVYAPLRGKAIAGARGNSQARIFAHSLEAELVSIAGIYRTSEVPLPDKVRGKAALVRLQTDDSGDKLIMEPLG